MKKKKMQKHFVVDVQLPISIILMIYHRLIVERAEQYNNIIDNFR